LTFDLSTPLVGPLPGGRHTQLFRDAKVLLNRLTEEKKLLGALEAGIKSRAKASIMSAVSAARGMAPPFDHPKLAEAEALVARIEQEEGITLGLRAACKARDLVAIDKLLAQV
jgi:hypothetical protein